MQLDASFSNSALTQLHQTQIFIPKPIRPDKAHIQTDP